MSPLSSSCGAASKAAATALLLVAAVPAGLPAPAEAQEERTSTQFERRAAGESELSVNISFGAGRFTLGRAGEGTLYRAVMNYPQDRWDPIHRYDPGELQLSLEGRDGRHLMQQDEEPRMELFLSGSIPQDLELEMGAVRAEMELGGIALRSLVLATGASDTRLSADRPNPVEMEELTLRIGAASLRGEGLGYLNPRSISVEGGVGEVRLGLEGLTRSEVEIEASLGLGALELRIPQGVGVRLTRSSFLSTLHAPFLERRGDAHYSTDWESADRRVRISVDSALGSVRLVRVDG